MNMLTEKLPDSVTVKGIAFPIKTDFRTWIRFSEIMSGEGEQAEKLAKAIRLVYGCLPPSLEETVTGMLDFFAVSAERDRSAKKVTGKRVYDFAHDAGLIVAAFRQQYGIDLLESELHWHEFRALLAGLTEDTLFVKVIGYRSINLSDIKDKDRKDFYRKMKEVYRLPDNRTEEEREADMIAELEGAF